MTIRHQPMRGQSQLVAVIPPSIASTAPVMAAASGEPALIEVARDPEAITTRTTRSEIRERAERGRKP